MRTVYLIRHGEADTGFGRKHVCLGQTDVPLSAEGEKQALRLAQFFKGKSLDKVYTSPLKRCMDTARIVTERSGHGEAAIDVVDDFAEADMGEWDGMTFAQIREQFPDSYERRGKELGTFVTRGGESLLAAGQRFGAAFQRVLSQSGGDLLVSAHAGVIQAFLCLMTGKEINCLKEYSVPCASVTVLELADPSGAGYDREELRKKLQVKVTGLRPVEAISLSEVDRIWAQCRVTEQQRAHMEGVADMAMNLIGYDMALVRADLMDTDWPFRGGKINVRAIYYAALLHDVKRSDGGREHAENGAAYLEKEGYLELARIVRMHHDPRVYRPGRPPSEAEIVYYADKLVQEDRLVSLQERFARSREKCTSAQALQNHEKQYQAALGIQEKLY